MTWLWVALAGGLGAVARFVVDAALHRRIQRTMPVPTLVINVVGSFLLGVLTGAVAAHSGLVPPTAKTIVGTGFCGGFTTFSTASVETARLWEHQGSSAAIRYAVVTVGCSLTAAFAGLWVGGLG